MDSARMRCAALAGAKAAVLGIPRKDAVAPMKMMLPAPLRFMAGITCWATCVAVRDRWHGPRERMPAGASPGAHRGARARITVQSGVWSVLAGSSSRPLAQWKRMRMARETSEQEAFWQGEVGDAYTGRNDGPALVAANTALFAKALGRAGPIGSLIEFGANRGLNLIALRSILPHCRLSGVEINAKAHAAASKLGLGEIWRGSLVDYPVTDQFDLSLVKGVLIHLAPDLLAGAYAKLYQASRRYILLAEYYNPSPVEISYRGHVGKLFKRDFA